MEAKVSGAEPNEKLGINDLLLAALDARIKFWVAEALSTRSERAVPSATDVIDEASREAIREQVLISNKTYLTRREVALYLNISERSIAEWSVRAPDQNPFPVSYAGGEPRYKRTTVEEWAVAEGRRQKLKLAK